MRPQNHASRADGIPKMKLQASGALSPKSLQSQNRCRAENRLSINNLAVVHGRLIELHELRDSVAGAVDNGLIAGPFRGLSF
jgi:hypothetical protein